MFAPRTNTISPNSTPSNFGGSNHAFIQPKLNIGQPGDKYEVEADKAADQIVARKEQSPSSFIAPAPIIQKQSEEDVQKQETENEIVQQKPVVESITPLIQRKNSEDEDVVQTKCAACGKEKEIQKKNNNDFTSSIQTKESVTRAHTIQQKCACHKDESAIQRKEQGKDKESTLKTAMQQMQSNQSFESRLATSKGKGNKLDNNTQAEMESGFGADFSNVRVHTDSEATSMSQEIGAQAFTNGKDIYFNEGKYNPQSDTGKHLLAHELTHTIQQGASSSKDIQRIEMPGFVQDGLDIVSGTYDNAVDMVADGMYDVGEALGVNDEILEAYEMAEDVYDAATEYLIKAKDWLLTTAGQAARALVEALGGTMNVTEEGIIITFPKTCPIEAKTFDIEIPPIEQELLYPAFIFPVIVGVIDGVFIGGIGGKMVIDPEMNMQLGPFCLEGARMVINPLTGNFSAEGGVSATAAVSMGAEVRGAIKADLSFMGIALIGEIPIPLDISLVSIEGGLAGLGRGIGAGKKTLEGSLGYNNGSLVMNSSDQLDLGLAADLFIGAYGQMDIGGFNFCRLYWDLFEWHEQIGAMFNTSTSIVIGPNPSYTETTTAEIGEFPFNEYELLLGRGGFKDDCPFEDMLCWLAEKFGHFPSQNDGTWKDYGAGVEFREGPLEVFGRDPKRASGAKCRGACGPDCDTCNHEDKHRYKDPETGEIWEYTNFEDCNTHTGCKEHDAGFDWAAETKGESKENEGIIPSFLKYWHMLANLECFCNYEARECVGWIKGKPPYEGKLLFADSVTKVTGKDVGEGDSLHDKIQAIEIFFFDKDPEEHKLFIEIKESGEVIIMMASDDPGPLKDKNLDEQRNDDTDTPEEETLLRRGEELRKELVDFIHKHLKNIKGGEDETTANSIRNEVTAKLQVIAETVSEGGIDHNAEIPKSYVSYEMESKRAKKVTAFPLTNKPGNTTGSKPTTDDEIPLGWPHVRSFDLFPDKNNDLRITNWVKFHLLHNKKMHGPGVVWNLVPAAGKDNANYYRSIEEPMEKKLKGAKNSHRIFSFDVTVNNYRKATDEKPYLSDFPESLTVNAKEYNNDLTEKETIYNGKPFKFQVLPKDSRPEGEAGSFIIVDGGEPNLIRFTKLDTFGARVVAKMDKYSTVPTFSETLVEIAKNRESFKTRVGYLRNIKDSLGEFRRDKVLEAMIYLFSESDTNINIVSELESKAIIYDALLEENTTETLNKSFNEAVKRNNNLKESEIKKRVREKFKLAETTLRGYLKGDREPNPYLIKGIREYLDTL
ncbi:MAG: DUF4157 domain-containing protein [Flavobacteriaceae bacterium]